eukprot:ctg_1363.g614
MSGRRDEKQIGQKGAGVERALRVRRVGIVVMGTFGAGIVVHRYRSARYRPHSFLPLFHVFARRGWSATGAPECTRCRCRLGPKLVPVVGDPRGGRCGPARAVGDDGHSAAPPGETPTASPSPSDQRAGVGVRACGGGQRERAPGEQQVGGVSGRHGGARHSGGAVAGGVRGDESVDGDVEQHQFVERAAQRALRAAHLGDSDGDRVWFSQQRHLGAVYLSGQLRHPDDAIRHRE